MENGRLGTRYFGLIMMVTCVVVQTASSNPVLTPGVWTDISPAGVSMGPPGYGATDVEIYQSNPSIMFFCSDGIYKTTDAGSSWVRLGTPPSSPNWGNTATFVPAHVMKVDPRNSNHLYATCGVGGSTFGFWVSTDGGANWRIPPGFDSTNTTRDVNALEVDPSDFNHVLVGSHSPWNGRGLNKAGFVESRDGGATWNVILPPAAWPDYTRASIEFAYNPDNKMGDSTGNTWIIETDAAGIWRTTNAGVTLSKSTSGADVGHGGGSLYIAKNGAMYTGATPYPARSTDNGASWTALSGSALPSFYYVAVVGDGNLLYTIVSYPDNTARYNACYYVSPETDGLTWQAYDPFKTGAQHFDNGATCLRFDKVNRIVYAAALSTGLWALKVVDPTSATMVTHSTGAIRAAPIGNALRAVRSGIEIRTATGKFFDVKGRKLKLSVRYRWIRNSSGR